MDKKAATPPRELARLLLIYGKFGVVRAIRAAIQGDTALLAQLFRSGRQLSTRERKLLACYVEGRFDRRPGRPREKANRWYYPGDPNARNAVKRAATLVRLLKAEAKSAGFKYKDEQGRSVADRVVEVVVEYYSQTLRIEVPLEALHTELKRSRKPLKKSRKNSR